MNPYIHRVHYYETDRMGVTHHSNYIRMMEEARIDFMEQLGWPYARMEALGMGSPVTAVNVRYHTSTTFDDRVEITVRVRAFDGVRLTIGYTMTKQAADGGDALTVLTGESEHVFLHADGRFVRLKRELPEFHALLTELAEQA